MDGFLGFGRSASKQNKSEPSKDASKLTQSAPAKPNATEAPLNTPRAQTGKANNTPDSSKQAAQDRSSNMRLSKTPPQKVDNDFDIPADPIAPSPTYTSSSTNIGTKVEPRITPCATIGPKISFKGELSGEEDLLVQGYVEGTINLKNNHLIIGKQGTVKANILAKTITVEGRVEGDIVGQDKVEIKATSSVNGNLKAERVTLEDGAKFRGSIDMGTNASQKPTPETLHTAKPTTKAESSPPSSPAKTDSVSPN